MIKNSPGLAEERRTAAAKAKEWDLKLVRLIHVALPATLVAAALDMRFRWFPAVPVAVSIAALAMTKMQRKSIIGTWSSNSKKPSPVGVFIK